MIELCRSDPNSGSDVVADEISGHHIILVKWLYLGRAKGKSSLSSICFVVNAIRLSEVELCGTDSVPTAIFPSI